MSGKITTEEIHRKSRGTNSASSKMVITRLNGDVMSNTLLLDQMVRLYINIQHILAKPEVRVNFRMNGQGEEKIPPHAHQFKD